MLNVVMSFRVRHAWPRWTSLRPATSEPHSDLCKRGAVSGRKLYLHVSHKSHKYVWLWIIQHLIIIIIVNPLYVQLMGRLSKTDYVISLSFKKNKTVFCFSFAGLRNSEYCSELSGGHFGSSISIHLQVCSLKSILKKHYTVTAI